MTTWNIYIDWDRDFSFSQAGDEIFDDVITVSWSLGFGKAYQNVSDETTCEIVVRNDTGKYSPENTESVLYGKLLPQRMVKITATVNGSTYVMWRGWVNSIKPDWKSAGAATGKLNAVINCVGAKQFLQDADVSLQLMLNKRGDQIVDEVLQRIVVPPVKSTGWLLGIPGFSELGEPPDGNTILGSKEDYSTVETGELTFATYGDTRQLARPSEVDGWRIIKDVTEAERGHFFFDREGYAVWWNRSHFLDDWEDDGIMDSTGASGERPLALSYDYGKSVMTRAQVVAHQRQEGSVITLWTLDHTITVQGGDTVSFAALYTDENSQQAGAESVVASGAVFSSGTADIFVSGLADRAEVRIYNSGTSPAVLTALNVQGTVLTANNRIVVSRQDVNAIAVYGRRKELKLTLSAIDNLEDALEITRFELDRRSEARGEVDYFVLKREADGIENLSQLLWTIGTRLRVKLPELDHEDSYFVVGEQHTVRKGGKIHETRYVLEPCIYTRLVDISHEAQDVEADLQNSATNKTSLAQSFTTPAQAYRLKKIRKWLKKAGLPTGDLSCSLYSESGNEPSSLIDTSDVVAASELVAGYQWVDFSFPSLPALDASTKYWSALETTDSAHASNYITWGAIETSLLTGLVSYWSLEEASSTRVDAHGSNDLTPNSTPSSTTGKQGDALRIASVSQYLKHADNADLSPTGNFTWAGWVRLSALTAYVYFVNRMVSVGQRAFTIAFDLSANRFTFTLSNDGTAYSGYQPANTFGAPSANTWYFLVAWHDADNDQIGISVNDVADSKAYALGVHDSTDEIRFGYPSGGVTVDMDEWALWNRVLSSDTRTWLYNAGSGRNYTDLTVYTGEMKSEVASVWSAEGKDAILEVYGVV